MKKKKIKLSDFRLKEEIIEEAEENEWVVEVKLPEFKPLFLWMEEKDIYHIVYDSDHIDGFDNGWNKIYEEYKSDRTLWKHNIRGSPVYCENSRGKIKERKHHNDDDEVFFTDSFGYKRIQEWNRDWLVYRADSNRERMQMIDGTKVEYRDLKYYIDWEEADLVIRSKT